MIPLVLALGTAACRVESHPPERRVDPAAEARTGDSVAVMALLHAYYMDMSARDWDAYAGYFWPGADITTTWQPPGDSAERVVVTPVPEFVAQAPSGPGSREIFEERPLAMSVTLSGDLAQAWVSYHARFGDSGAVAEWDGIDAFTLLRHAGEWRIVELVFASEPGGP